MLSFWSISLLAISIFLKEEVDHSIGEVAGECLDVSGYLELISFLNPCSLGTLRDVGDCIVLYQYSSECFLGSTLSAVFSSDWNSPIYLEATQLPARLMVHFCGALFSSAAIYHNFSLQDVLTCDRVIYSPFDASLAQTSIY